MKRNLIIILVVLVAAAAGFIYFTKDDVVFSKETSLYKAVPITAPVFIEFSSLRAIPKNNPVLTELLAVEDFSWVIGKVNEIESFIKNDSEIQNQLGKKPIVLALDFIGKNVVAPVIISQLKSAVELKGFNKLLSKLVGLPVSSFTTRKYDGYKIVDITDREGKNNLHYCATSGLIILSTEGILVEKCIRQLNSRNITDNQFFNKVNKTVTAQSDVAWYINHNRFPDLLANFLNNRTVENENEFGETIKRNLNSSVKSIRNYASWSELDMTFDDNRIALNGITTANDSLNHFLSIFQGQEAVSCQADRVLPKNTSFYLSFSFSERDLLFKNLQSYFELSSSYFKRESRIKKIDKQFRADIRVTLRSLVKSRVIAAITTVPAQTNNKSTLFILNNESRKENKKVFENLLQNYAKNTEVDFSSLYRSYKTNEGNNYRIYSFPFPSLPEIWLGKSFAFTKSKYAVLWNDNLVFGNSEEALQKYLKDMDSGANLYRNSSYAEFKQANESSANIDAYLKIGSSYALNKELFNTAFSKGFDTNEEIFRKFDAIGWQVVCEKNIYFNSLNINFNSKPKIDASALWQINIGANVNMKPQIVINHRNKASKEVIVQDENNQLHLIGADGEVIWNAPIKGKILGKIHQIDYYRNGKLQYFFNTKEKLYLLDRNGEMVANFPVIFKSPATNGVNVFDYDNNRMYRYFIACENKKVYAYNHEGKIITGWKFGQTTSAVTTPVQHFRVNNKDYIVFKDKSKVYIQNRQGQTRVNCLAKFENSNNPLVLNTNGTPKIVASDKTGKVFYLYFNGKYAEKKTDRFSKDHYFTVGDVNGNGVPDFVFVDGKQLKVMDENGKKLFSKKFDNELALSTNLYTFPGKQTKIGVSDSDEDLIYLFDATGKLDQGFPLPGNSEFSIGELTNLQLNLVVGNSEGYLCNYILE